MLCRTPSSRPVRIVSNFNLLAALVLTWSAGCAGSAAGRDDPRVVDLIEIHREAIGGRGRIDGLSALRASGRVIAGGKTVTFQLSAARPDRIRLETRAGERMRVQGFDGVAAWEADSGVPGQRGRTMDAAVAKTFVAAAEFDDPLVAGAGRGFVFEFAGEQVREGRRHLRLLVTRNLTEVFTLLIDATSYLVVARVEQRPGAGGRTTQVVTDWSDFRPVAGVLLAHRIKVSADGRLLQETQIAEIEANPSLGSGEFRPPGAEPRSAGGA